MPAKVNINKIKEHDCPDRLERNCPEIVFQNHVVACAKANGWLVYHTHDSRRSQAGFPDLVIVDKQKTLFIELKSTKGSPSKMQQAWIDALQHQGQRASICKPDEWKSIKALLHREM